MFLLAGFCCTNLGSIPNLAFDSQFFQQVQKPMHGSDGFDPHQHRVRKLSIKLPHLVAFVHQRSIHKFSGLSVEHRQRLLASMQITSYNSHSASFDPSAVRVNIETVYSARREADLVMTSIIGTDTLRVYRKLPEKSGLHSAPCATHSASDCEIPT